MDLGFDTGQSETPIIPVMIGDEQKAREFSARLLEEGVYTQEILFPMVAKGKARLRTIVSACHSKDDLEQALQSFAKIGKRLGTIL